jgi:hypothetical protein
MNEETMQKFFDEFVILQDGQQIPEPKKDFYKTCRNKIIDLARNANRIRQQNKYIPHILEVFSGSEHQVLWLDSSAALTIYNYTRKSKDIILDDQFLDYARLLRCTHEMLYTEKSAVMQKKDIKKHRDVKFLHRFYDATHSLVHAYCDRQTRTDAPKPLMPSNVNERWAFIYVNQCMCLSQLRGFI